MTPRRCSRPARPSKVALRLRPFGEAAGKTWGAYRVPTEPLGAETPLSFSCSLENERVSVLIFLAQPGFGLVRFV